MRVHPDGLQVIVLIAFYQFEFLARVMELVPDLRQPGFDRHLLPVHAQVGMIEARIVEHRCDELIDFLHVAVQIAESRLERRICVVVHHRQRKADSRQRCAHFVRQCGDQLFLALYQAAQPRRHVVQVAGEARELGGPVRGRQRFPIIGGKTLRGRRDQVQVLQQGAQPETYDDKNRQVKQRRQQT